MAGKVRTVDQAIAFYDAQEASGTLHWDGRCADLANSSYDIDSDGSPDAKAKWARTKHRGVGTPVRGAFVWWTVGEHGHVGVADGKGNLKTNWWVAPFKGRVRTIPIKAVSASLGADPVGWSRDIEGVLAVPEVVAPAAPPAIAVPDFKVVNLGATPNDAGIYPGVVGDLLALCGWARDASGAKALQRYLGRPTTGRLGKQELAWLAQRFGLATK